MAFSFELQHTSDGARAGALRTDHGEVPTPVFMPVGTQGAVKAMTPGMLRDLGARIVLANTYHLVIRPGSDLVAELGVEEIACPYTGERLLAAPAIRPDVCVIHAEAADEHGNVLAPSTKDFLFDADANIARAAEAVVVTAERIVPTSDIRSGGALLFSYEVTAVVEAPHGAWPTALPGLYGADVAAVRAYLEEAGADPAAAAGRVMRGPA